jgi:hypothetical protein
LSPTTEQLDKLDMMPGQKRKIRKIWSF